MNVKTKSQANAIVNMVDGLTGRKMTAEEIRDVSDYVADLLDAGTEKYRIWCHERSQWWRPNGDGYTYKFEEGGLYTREEAIEICREANSDCPPDESMIPA